MKKLHRRWVHPKYADFFLPVKVLSQVFRGKFVDGLRRMYAHGELDLSGVPLRDRTRWHRFVEELFRTDWVVYAKPAADGKGHQLSGITSPDDAHRKGC